MQKHNNRFCFQIFKTSVSVNLEKCFNFVFFQIWDRRMLLQREEMRGHEHAVNSVCFLTLLSTSTRHLRAISCSKGVLVNIDKFFVLFVLY